MSKNDTPLTGEPATDNDGPPSSEAASKQAHRFSDRGLLIVLMVLIFVGVTLTNFTPFYSTWYWLAMIPVFAVAAIISGGSKSLSEGAIVQNRTVLQILHWSVSLLTASTVFVFSNTGRLTDENTSLVMLLILALATVLDGIRLGWLLSLVGTFLGVTAVIAAYIDEFLWIILAIATAIVLTSIYWKKDGQGVVD